MPWDRTTQQIHKRPDDHSQNDSQNDLTDAEWTGGGRHPHRFPPPMHAEAGKDGTAARGADLRSVLKGRKRHLTRAGISCPRDAHGGGRVATLWISTVFHRPEPFLRMAAERAPVPGASTRKTIASSPGPRAAVSISGALRGADRCRRSGEGWDGRAGSTSTATSVTLWISTDRRRAAEPRGARLRDAGGVRGAPRSRPKVKGRKRHLIVDAGGTPVVMTVHTADIQDRDGAPDLDLTAEPPVTVPTVCRPFADGGRLSKDYERLCENSLASKTGTAHRT